jgi:hypothetical protein
MTRSTRLAHDNRPTYRKTVRRVADDRIEALCKTNIDRSRPVERLLHEPVHLIGIADRHDRHVRQRSHDRDVLDREVSRPERGVDKTAAIPDQPDWQIVQAEIDRDLLVTAPGYERRDSVDVGDKPFHRHTSGHADHMSLADPLHEGAPGHFGLHPLGQVRA